MFRVPNSNLTSRIIDLVGVVRRPLESWWRQPTFRRAYADHLSLWPRARRVLVWVTVSKPPTISKLFLVRTLGNHQ